jgi:transcriptional regulator with XRE-family HTH domain
MEKSMTHAIGERLKQARQDAGLTQESVAAEFKRTRQAISSWEHGKTLPSLGEFRDLATLYGKSADVLLYGVKIEEVSESLFGRLCALGAPPPDFADSAMT